MGDRPIIFSAPMVQAILAGWKTQTRRKSRLQPFIDSREVCQAVVHASTRFRVGDRLWVREAAAAWMRKPALHDLFKDGPVARSSITYKADETAEKWAEILNDRRILRLAANDMQDRPGNWIVYSPIHMPRWASRFTLTVTDVRVQRLQEISEEDAIAEGACVPAVCEVLDLCGGHEAGMCACQCVSPSDLFSGLWESIHGPGAWDANPWVVAITFTVERRNIDSRPGSDA